MSATFTGHIDLLHGTALLVQSVSGDGRVQFANDAWKATLGYSDADLERGVQIQDVIAPDELARMETLFARLMREGGHAHLNTTVVSRAGERVDIVGELSARRDGNGMPMTAGIFRDVTEENRERIAASLRSQMRFAMCW